MPPRRQLPVFTCYARALGTGELPLAWEHRSRKKYETGLRKLDSEVRVATGSFCAYAQHRKKVSLALVKVGATMKAHHCEAEVPTACFSLQGQLEG